jgi:hypothetical protein
MLRHGLTDKVSDTTDKGAHSISDRSTDAPPGSRSDGETDLSTDKVTDNADRCTDAKSDKGADRTDRCTNAKSDITDKGTDEYVSADSGPRRSDTSPDTCG